MSRTAALDRGRPLRHRDGRRLSNLVAGGDDFGL